MKFFSNVILLSAVATLASAEDILEALIKRPETRTIATMIKKEGVDKDIRGYDDGQSKWTFFAITNAAYTSQPRRNLAFLSHPRNRDVLRRVIEYHVIPGSISYADLINLAKTTGEVKTFGGEMLPLKIQGGELIVGAGGKVVTQDIAVDQGYVQILDSVLYPKNTVPDARI